MAATTLRTRRSACRAGSHDWIARVNDQGDHYEVCLGCGKQAHWIPLWSSA